MEAPKCVYSLLKATIAVQPYGDVAVKNEFHRLGRCTMECIVGAMGIVDEMDYDVRSNMGGITVCGAITLHTNKVYIQMSKSDHGTGRIMYRSCRSLRDYSGGKNYWICMEDLLNWDDAIALFMGVK